MAYFGARLDISRGEAVCYVSLQSSNIDTRPTIRPVGKRGMEKERKGKKMGRREKGKKEKRKIGKKERKKKREGNSSFVGWLLVSLDNWFVCGSPTPLTPFPTPHLSSI